MQLSNDRFWRKAAVQVGSRDRLLPSKAAAIDQFDASLMMRNSGPVIVIVETAMGYLDSIKLIDQQLAKFRSGKMTSGETTRDGRLDQTDADIDRLTASREDLVEAFEILTRQPADDGSARVHWYTLQRATPLFAPEQKDEWSIPGELSPEAALAYFTKHEGFDEGLEIANDDGPLTEFVLEKREVLRRHIGASQRLSAGRLIHTYSVRRRSK